jgi:PAS domain S-box-containing protein
MPKLFHTAFHGAAIGMSVVSLEGRFIRVNRALCQIVGYPEEELVTRTFQEMTHPDDLDSDLAYVGQMLRGEIKTYKLDKRYIRKDGSSVWVLLTVSILSSGEGQPRCFFSQMQDITARKEAEARLRATAEENLRLYEELRQATEEVAKLQEGLVTICAWTKQIRLEGEWQSVEEFLTEHLHLKLSHGMSDEVAGRMIQEVKYPSPDAAEPR